MRLIALFAAALLAAVTIPALALADDAAPAAAERPYGMAAGEYADGEPFYADNAPIVAEVPLPEGWTLSTDPDTFDVLGFIGVQAVISRDAKDDGVTLALLRLPVDGHTVKEQATGMCWLVEDHVNPKNTRVIQAGAKQAFCESGVPGVLSRVSVVSYGTKAYEQRLAFLAVWTTNGSEAGRTANKIVQSVLVGSPRTAAGTQSDAAPPQISGEAMTLGVTLPPSWSPETNQRALSVLRGIGVQAVFKNEPFSAMVFVSRLKAEQRTPLQQAAGMCREIQEELQTDAPCTVAATGEHGAYAEVTSDAGRHIHAAIVHSDDHAVQIRAAAVWDLGDESGAQGARELIDSLQPAP